MTISLEKKADLILKTWNLEETSVVPYIVEIGEPHFATTAFYDDDQAELDWNESYISDREQLDDFGIPNIKTNTGIGLIAAAFGCKSVVNDESDPWIKPLITKDNVSDVYTLKKPDLLSNRVYEKAFNRLEFLQSHTPRHIRTVNVPSPLVTASLIWEYTSFIQATIKYPAEVHALLDLVTETTIEFFSHQFEIVRNPISVSHELWHIPKEIGIRISDDTAALLSPKLYREFGLPYNAKISEAFGGIVIHSCGELKHVLPVMMETPGLRGIDLTIPQNHDWDLIKTAAVGKTPLNLRYFYWDHMEENIDSYEYTKNLLETFGTHGIFLQTSAPTLEEALQLNDKIRPLLM